MDTKSLLRNGVKKPHPQAYKRELWKWVNDVAKYLEELRERMLDVAEEEMIRKGISARNGEEEDSVLERTRKTSK